MHGFYIQLFDVLIQCLFTSQGRTHPDGAAEVEVRNVESQPVGGRVEGEVAVGLDDAGQVEEVAALAKGSVLIRVLEWAGLLAWQVDEAMTGEMGCHATGMLLGCGWRLSMNAHVRT